MRIYPDDRERNPVQLTLRQFVNEGLRHHASVRDGTPADEMMFLKFVLAGRQGLDLEDQRSVTVNVCQGLRDITEARTTRDFDSLIGTTRTLPYSAPLSIWPAPSFRDTLKANNHVTAVALDAQDHALRVPMHKIPNLPFGKVANRSVIRVFFPRMYSAFDSNKIPSADIELIYNRCLRPLVYQLLPNQATHWPPTYQVILQTSRDRGGRFHLGSLDVPSHMLSDFARLYLQRLQPLRPYFRDAYFGHELRGWKAATVHNLVPEADQDHDEPSFERTNALGDLTRVLDMPSVDPSQWLVDIGLEFGVRGSVVTWRSSGHQLLLRHLFPDIADMEHELRRSKKFYVDNQIHSKDLAGFRWTPGRHGDVMKYVQAYTTEKAVSYQLHEGVFRPRKASELLSARAGKKLLVDLNEQSRILFTCTGDNREEVGSVPQEGCARLEVRVPLARANEVLVDFPLDLINRTMVQIPARYWWYLKWLRLAAVYSIIDKLCSIRSQDRASENSLALGAIAIWLLNGAHRTPDLRFLGLAKEACAALLLNEGDDPEDPDAATISLMYEAGLYFVCDIVADDRSHCYRIPWAKQFSEKYIARAYEQGTLDQIRRILGSSQVQKHRCRGNAQRTSNRTTHQTQDVRNIRPVDHVLPEIGPRLDGLPLPQPRRPQGPDVDYFHQHGGGNRALGLEDVDEREPVGGQVANPLRHELQIILDQLYFDILHESPNKRAYTEGSWTNIPRDSREELAVEELYMRLEFPFIAVQFIIATDKQWETHFQRFFPNEAPPRPMQNFKKARYYHEYLSLIGRLREPHITWARAELYKKFKMLAWIPHTEADRMWCTKKTNPQRWSYLPQNGRTEGPKIAVNPTAIRRLQQRPSLRLPPRAEGRPEEEGEEGEREWMEEANDQEIE